MGEGTWACKLIAAVVQLCTFARLCVPAHYSPCVLMAVCPCTLQFLCVPGKSTKALGQQKQRLLFASSCSCARACQ